ncbi:MAG TPA: hypothetical protein VK174_15440, partial [Chitinophagales bacterium]|nr:hypothetical protein [Chitinophagales bacterium]
RHMVANDVNPLSLIFTRPRIAPPTLQQVKERLQDIPYIPRQNADIDLSMFFEKNTLSEIVSLRNYLMERLHTGREDNTDRWIRMVATNRLTGHSKGFFSVYSLPPNQAMSQERQIKVNKARGQKPDYRDTKKLMFTKSRILLRDTLPGTGAGIRDKYLNCDAGATRAIKSGSVSLTVTSPPFLDIVQYAIDNWMRCWFNDIDMAPIERNITMSRTVEDWAEKMRGVFKQLYRVTKPGGVVAFEVGEVRHGKIKLDETVVPLGISAGFDCEAILIHQQEFAKTANIWGIDNNSRGTNTNRIVIFRK